MDLSTIVTVTNLTFFQQILKHVQQVLKITNSTVEPNNPVIHILPSIPDLTSQKPLESPNEPLRRFSRKSKKPGVLGNTHHPSM